MTIDRSTPVVIRPESVGVAEGRGGAGEGQGEVEGGEGPDCAGGQSASEQRAVPPGAGVSAEVGAVGWIVCVSLMYQEARASAGRQAIRGHWFIQAGVLLLAEAPKLC